jgi:hypothetical protein
MFLQFGIHQTQWGITNWAKLSAVFVKRLGLKEISLTTVFEPQQQQEDYRKAFQMLGHFKHTKDLVPRVK